MLPALPAAQSSVVNKGRLLMHLKRLEPRQSPRPSHNAHTAVREAEQKYFSLRRLSSGFHRSAQGCPSRSEVLTAPCCVCSASAGSPEGATDPVGDPGGVPAGQRSYHPAGSETPISTARLLLW